MPAKALSAKKAASVRGGRKADGDPNSAGKPFLQFKFGTVFTMKELESRLDFSATKLR